MNCFLIVALLTTVPCEIRSDAAQPSLSAAIQFDSAALQGIRDAKLGAPVVARALAIVHTCMYDAWAAYDERAVGTQLGGALRRPAPERTSANKEQAISYAAYHALVDVLPVDTNSVYIPLMKQLGYDPSDDSTDIETPIGIGNVACAAVLEFRHHDKSNQLGDLAQGPYSDWTGYAAVNTPSPVPARAAPSDPNHWQPLTYVNSTGDLMTQRFVGAQWCDVTPFAMSKGDEYRWLVQLLGPAKYGSKEYQEQAQELVDISAGLTDRQKMIAEYWSDGPNSEQPPGHWALFAQFISARDHHTLDDDVKMFFVLSNAIFDAGIAAWDTKRAYDSVRPVTAIPFLFRGKTIRSWGGPRKGTVAMDGSQWIPYQAATFPTPPFPDYVSGHSTYSAAATRILELWTGSDRFGNTVTLPAGSSKIEPGVTPARPVTLTWERFTDAANEAGISRRYGGIHFRAADLAGRLLGRLVAFEAWQKAQTYFQGSPDVAIHPMVALTPSPADISALP
ncbi:MAG: vanadium-dependent haloperoxidase [Acidobacteriia bacterium]|nr:vanadium-dependent haloperoxidase [Terriglobia bacterium]